MERLKFWRKWTFWHWVTAVSLLVLAVVLDTGVIDPI